MVNLTLVNATAALISETNTTLLNASSSSKFAFLHTLANPVLLMFALPVLLVIVIMIFVIKNVTPVSHFLYANSRIQARSNYMVNEPLLLNLVEAKSLKELLSLLRETDYGGELEKSKDDLRSFHSALEKGFIDSILGLIELSPQKSKPLLDSYLRFFEMKILKVIYRARLMKEKVDESLVYAIGDIDERVLEHLLATETIADMGVVMIPTVYRKIFEKEYSSLEEFETTIDKFVFNNFVDVVKKTKMYDSKYIMDILNKKIDISNISALIKFRIRNIEKEKQKKLIINNGTELAKRFDSLIKAESMQDFVEEFKGLDYYEPMSKALKDYEKNKAMAHFETEVYRYFKKYVTDNDLRHTLGPYPLFSYLIKKELELRNMFIISRGIEAGFSIEKIKRMIV